MLEPAAYGLGRGSGDRRSAPGRRGTAHPMASIFVPKETAPGERRVAATPETVRRLVKDGHTVTVEQGAGLGAFYADDEYAKAGATLVADAAAGWSGADVVAHLNVPDAASLSRMRRGASFLGFFWPPENLELVRLAAERGISVFAMDALPRTTRAQKDDALTSQASLAGYKAVLLAASHLPRIFPLQMTPAGTIRPARVVVIGAGVAGLQAIATARRLGAIVEVSDVRPEVKEQAQSLGATYIEVEGSTAPGTGGYAADQSEEFKRKQQETLRAHLVAADAVICTALIPYRPAPRIVTEEIVRAMRPGSVIVDLAAERGGNCACTEAGRTVVRHGVTIVGDLNLAATVSTHASDQYAKNVQNVLSDATKKGVFAWDLADEIVAGALVVHAGEVRHPKTREALGLPPLAPDRGGWGRMGVWQ